MLTPGERRVLAALAPDAVAWCLAAVLLALATAVCMLHQRKRQEWQQERVAEGSNDFYARTRDGRR